jgi:ligand-binding sensor domain-containing protein
MSIKRIIRSCTPRGGVRLFRARPKLVLGMAGLCLLSAFAAAVWVREQARQSLADERERVLGQEFIPFERRTRAPQRRNEIKFWQNTEATRAVVRFQDSYFAATDGGLVQFTPEGNTSRHYTVLDGLTESDLTALAVFDSKLFIGTRSEGLLAFDGERFESYRWLDRKAQAVTALLADGGRLLVGTFAGGLIEFDGLRFTELRAGAERVRVRAVNCLSKQGTRLYVGTFDDGLWLLEAGRWLHFETGDGLASNRVVGIVAGGGQLFVASDFGLAAAASDALQETGSRSTRSFRTLATLPTLTGLVAYGDLLLLSKDDGELLALDREATARATAQVKNLNWPRPADLSGGRLALVDDALWLVGSRGIWRAREDALARGRAQLSWEPFGHAGDGQPLTTNIINALAIDGDGNFWAGNFRRGIDVLSADGKKLTHLESEAVREINFLLTDAGAKNRAVLAATSQGLVRFDEQFRATSVTKADGLPSNSVMHLALADGSQGSAGSEATPGAASSAASFPVVLATARGLSLGRPGGRLRALTTVQGLPSDQVYTTLFFRGALFAGTLGGLAQIDADRVVRVFKDSNSKLTHNWVTGLCAAGGRLFVGTYGGGVFELTASNELHSFSQEIGTTSVNPNAMWSDERLLFVGTLDGAWVFDLHSQKWTHLKDELPAQTVLSVAGDDRYVYFGTTSGVARVEKSYLAAM